MIIDNSWVFLRDDRDIYRDYLVFDGMISMDYLWIIYGLSMDYLWIYDMIRCMTGWWFQPSPLKNDGASQLR